MPTALSRLAAFALSLALVGCIQSAPAPAPAPQAAARPEGYATQRYTPPSFALPGGEGCQGDVSRFRAVMGNDYQTGNVNLSVYRRISAEIDQADQACASGNAAQASAMIRATKAKFGYP
jgi:hypothetical protein